MLGVCFEVCYHSSDVLKVLENVTNALEFCFVLTVLVICFDSLVVCFDRARGMF